MPQLLTGGGGSLSTSGLVLAQPGNEISSSGGSSGNSSRASSTSSSSTRSGRFRAVVAISSDDDRDRIFYDDDQNIDELHVSGVYRPKDSSHPVVTTTEFRPMGVGPRPPPPPAPPKPPNTKPIATIAATTGKTGTTTSAAAAAKRKSPLHPSYGVDNNANNMAATATLGIPEAAHRWCGSDGSVPKVIAHENGAIVNGYLLVNGTDQPLDVTRAGLQNGSNKRYHVSELEENGKKEAEQEAKAKQRSQVVSESTFAGSRDVKDPDTLRDLKIVSSKGTIRGVKNRVRAGIATFLDHVDQQDGKTKNYRGLEKDKMVIYVTSMRIIRETYERCQKARMILQTHMVCYEEVDIFMSKENQRDLMERLGTDHVVVPQVFADGQHLGGVEELESMNETGELRQIFQNFKKVQHTSSCTKCGGYRFVNCPQCHGSKKSLNRNHFTEEFCALRCVNCDENGLVRCDGCSDQEPPSSKK